MDIEKKVRKAIEKIEKSRTPLEPFDLFGIEHYYGWLGLTIPILEEIRKFNETNPKNKIKIDQIKQKFGGLRIYITEAPEYIRAMILKAEQESFKICEICGARGELSNINGWYLTLCGEHKKAKEEAKKDKELEEKLYREKLDIKKYVCKACNGKKEL